MKDEKRKPTEPEIGEGDPMKRDAILKKLLETKPKPHKQQLRRPARRHEV